MSELDQTIEELEAEVLAELEEAAHDAPTKGSVPAEKMKKAKTVGNDEVQDGGAVLLSRMMQVRQLMLPLIKQQRYLVMHSKRMKGKPDPMQKIKKVGEEIREAAHEDEDEDEEEDDEDDEKQKDEMKKSWQKT